MSSQHFKFFCSGRKNQMLTTSNGVGGMINILVSYPPIYRISENQFDK